MEPFRFKHFCVSHSRSPLRVGTDGVSLGAWASARGRVLDVGAGCGLIGLMLAQRGASEVTLLEIDPEGADEAALNAAASPWAHMVSSVCGDFLDFRDSRPFDSIVSNPPFFASGALSPNARRAAARHQGQLTADRFMSCAAALLAPHGTVSVILPPDQLEPWTFAARLASLLPDVTCALHTKPSAPPRRFLVSFARQGRALKSQLAINSPEYKALVSDFYL